MSQLDMSLRVLGPLEVTTATQGVPIRSGKVRTLLAALLLNSNRVLPVSTLVAALWGDEPPSSAVKNLHSYVHRLRSTVLSEVGLDDRLRNEPGGYRFLADASELDLLAFADAAERVRVAMAGRAYPHVVDLCTSALSYWRGPVLGDLPGDVLDQWSAQIHDLDEARWRMIDDLVTARFALGQERETIGPLRAAILEQPFSEALPEHLMQALFRCGRKSEALGVYRETARLFDDELGVEPGPSLQHLHTEILRDAEPALVVAAEPAVDTAPALLPRDVPDFVGHAAELDVVATELTTGTRVVVVSGPVGVGATSLAVHVAHRISASFPGGVLYAPLGGDPDVSALLRSFLHALGASADGDDVDLLSAEFRSRIADPRAPVLLVLDDVSATTQVLPLLPSAGHSAALITARSSLGTLAGARHVTVGELDDGAARLLLERVAGSERLVAEPAATRRLLDVCAGLPIALRVAGARLRARPGWRVADLAGRFGGDPGSIHELDYDGLSVWEAVWSAIRPVPGAAGSDPAQVCAALAGPASGSGRIRTDTVATALRWSRVRVAMALETLVDCGVLRSVEADQYRMPSLVRLAIRAGEPARSRS